MAFRRMLDKVGGSLFSHRKSGNDSAPVLSEARRFPYGPFSFKASLSSGAAYTILASSDLNHWNPIASGTGSAQGLEYLDSDASKFSNRFYRVIANDLSSQNVIGFIAITLPPGFSLIANPLESPHNTVADLFKGWPEGTCLNRFDTRLFKLSENIFAHNRWTQPEEKLLPGDGAIFFNPTNDYKSHSFVGEVLQGHLARPVPAGFSLRSSSVPQAGNLADDLHFPIADGDIIHLFDRDHQKYVLYPFENGKWKSGPPILGVGEAFWIAKTEPGNWTREVNLNG